jgi:ABC-type transport system involved in multi-copper enzyme maturation permease subunit
MRIRNSSRKRGPVIGAIVKKEIVTNLLSYKFFVVIGLTVILLAISLFVMSRDYKDRRADFELNRPKAGESVAVIPPNPLSIFAKGLDEAMARSFDITKVGINVQTSRQSGNVIFSFFPSPDFVYIVKVVLSLVALLFGFDQISREREQGTLKLMLANPLSRTSVLAGKWLGNYLSLVIPFLLVTLPAIAVLGLDTAIRLPAEGVGRLALLIAASCVYIALFLSLGLFISAVTRRSATSLVVLLFIWSLLVFILPNLGTLLARQCVELPSIQALHEKQQQILTREILLSYSDKAGVDAHIKAAVDEYGRLEEDYLRKFDGLVRLSKAVDRVSPAASFVFAATEIAGTGIGEERSLKEDVLRYKNRIHEDMRSGIARHAAFAHRYRSVGRVLAEGGLIDLACLFLFTIGFVAAGYAAILRYDVR